MTTGRFCCSWSAILVAALLFGSLAAGTLSAAIVQTGSVTPNVNFWTGRSVVGIGDTLDGSVTVNWGSSLASASANIGPTSGVKGTVTVTGAGSNWSSTFISVGTIGVGTLTIERGGLVSSLESSLGYGPDSTGTATVTGAGSIWSISRNYLYVGTFGSGTLTIKDGGLVNVGGTLTIDYDSPIDSFVNMTTGGMLALYGDADDSLSQFLGLVQGTDAIRFWDDSQSAWAPLATATLGVDYTLEYLATGDLAGYTLLTVGAITSSGLAGDFNGDGFVDAADYTVWRDGLGTVYTHDGYGLWAGNYGASVDAGAGGAVPEPGATGLSLATLALCSAVRR